MLAILLYPGGGMASDVGSGAASWGKQMARAPHRSYTGKEYCREKWNIIMPQMATYGQLSFHEAQNIAAFIGSATDPCGDTWFDKNLLLGGYGALTSERDKDEGETTTTALYAQHIFALLSERLLFQAELEFEKPVSPSADVEFEGAEYLNLTYFAGEHVQATVGKVLNDFNYSNLRLHPVWMNLAITQPWAAGFIPSTTLGGKLGVHWETNKNIFGATLFGGGDSDTNYLEADEMIGLRVGAYLPAKTLEMGLSAARAEENDDETVYGVYAIKKFDRLKLEGELAWDSDRMSHWIGGTVRPWRSKMGSRVSLVTRFQEFRVDEPEHVEGDDHGEEVHADSLNVAREDEHGDEEEHAEENHGEEAGHHALLPGADAKEWFFGFIYDHPAINNLHLRFQAGYVAGSGAAHDGWRAQAAFNW